MRYLNSSEFVKSVQFIVHMMFYPYITKDIKEEHKMKAATIQNRTATKHMSAYPNGITQHQVAQKIIDILLVFAIGTGLAAILLFLMALA